MLHAAALALVLLLQQKIDEKRVAALVEKFGAEEILERDEAMTELLGMGEAVVPLLEKAKSTAEGDAKARLGKLIDDLTLPARWAKEIIEAESGQGYQRLEEALKNKTLERPQAARIMSAVLLSEAASQEHRQYMVNLSERHRIRDIWPALVQLLGRDEPGNENFVYHLQRIKPPKEAAAAILKLIPKCNFNVAHQMLELARQLKPERAALEACVGQILEGDDDNLKQNVMSYIQQGRYPAPFKSLLKCWRDMPAYRPHYLREPILRTPPGDALNDILAMLKSNEPEEVNLAIDYVTRQKVAAAADTLAKLGDQSPELRPRILLSFKTLRCEDEIRKWIAGQGGPGRIAAIAISGELGWTGLGPDVARCLDDADAAVRSRAAGVCGSLKVADAAPKLEALLKDADSGVRRGALLSLAAIQGKSATKTVLAQLKSDDADVQAAAVECLALVDVEAVLGELTSEDALGRPITRYALAAMIVKGGQTTLHRVMARVGSKLSADELHAQIRLIQSVPK